MPLVRLLLLPALRLEFKFNIISYKNTAELPRRYFCVEGILGVASAGQGQQLRR
jgi:hypothetical protein